MQNELLNRLIERLKVLPPPAKLSIAVMSDLCVCLIALAAARIARVPYEIWPPAGTWHLHLTGPIFSVLSLVAIGFYRSAARSHTVHLERQIVLSQAIAAAAWLVYLRIFDLYGFPRSIVGIYPVFATVGLVASRRLAGHLLNSPATFGAHSKRIPVLIYGNGPEMMSLAQALSQAGQYKPVGFITTDYTLIGRMMAGLRVYDTSEIVKAKLKHNVKQVLLSGSMRSGKQVRNLFELMISNGLSTKIVPNVNDLAAGKGTGAIRELALEDILGREVVVPMEEKILAAVANLTVLITGAGGSIGSEIARQCQKHGATKILLVDNSEFLLFEIHRELEAKQANESPLELVPLLADVKSRAQMAAIFNSHNIDTVFHAAAYKHVRMVQENVIAGIRNNVDGTQVVAEAAMHAKCKRFVLISTDKAVRPTSVMGATKRVAELVVQGLAQEAENMTLFCMVRFGNVLGSNGSVVPIFRGQIAKGGPVTVTHPEVTRYFMAIPEAAELVLQAAGLAHSGEVLVLDMGEPIKIVQLARNLIELAGHTVRSPETPDGDIEIIYTGLKPGEKMYEELEIGNDLSPTVHPRILSSKEYAMGYAVLRNELNKLEECLAEGRAERAVEIVMNLAMRGTKGDVHSSN